MSSILPLQAYDPHEGKDNERRLTGTSETSSIHDFSAGVRELYCCRKKLSQQIWDSNVFFFKSVTCRQHLANSGEAQLKKKNLKIVVGPGNTNFSDDDTDPNQLAIF